MTSTGPRPLEIESVWPIKRDPFFYLQRVSTRAGQKFLAKLPAADGSFENEALLKREFAAFSELDSDRVLQPLELVQQDGRIAALYRDFDGLLLGGPIASDTLGHAHFADIVTELCSLLGTLHSRGLLLLGITPHAFLYSATVRRALLVDAAFVSRPEALAGMQEIWLAQPFVRYAAPELVSRTRQLFDHRADLYSLGVVLYELLSGHPPFESDDSAEVIQGHLARRPRPLGEIVPELPDSWCAQVMKLLAKQPSDRPASAAEVVAEMMRDFSLLRARTDAPPSTPPRRLARRRGPQQLYGRSEQIRLLRHYMQHAGTETRLVVLEGDAGVGKSALLDELRKLSRDEPGYYCGGRCEPQAALAPLGAWASALKELADHVLARGDKERETWRERILSRLGAWAPLLGALVPEWNLLLRCTSPGFQVNLSSSLNRLGAAIHGLLACFASAESPVLVALDDLHSADASSLELLRLVLTSTEPLPLLVVATVRSEAGAASALSDWWAQLAKARLEIERIVVTPLHSEDLLQLLHEHCPGSIQEPEALSAIVQRKTAGSPLFATELLSSLLDHDALQFDSGLDTWVWSARAIEQIPVGESLIEFLVGRIRALPPALREVLRLASCIGRQFHAEDVGLAGGGSLAQIDEQLERALDRGLLRRAQPTAPQAASAAHSGVLFEFTHERLSAACLALTKESDRLALQLRMGRALVVQLGVAPSEEQLCRAAAHLGVAHALIDDTHERFSSARLLLRAGQLRRARCAFSQAQELLRLGLVLLGWERGQAPNATLKLAWQTEFALTLELHQSAAEAALLNGQWPFLQELCSAVLSHARGVDDQVQIYNIQIAGLAAQRRFAEATAAALRILSELGVKLPNRPGLFSVAAGYLFARRRLRKLPIAELVALPAAQDPRARAVMSVLRTAYAAAYLSHPELFALLIYRHVEASLQHGNEDYSAVTYTGFAAIMCAMGDVRGATALGQAAMELLERSGARHLKARAYPVYYFLIFPWQHALAESVPHLLEGITIGMQYGDYEFAAYTITMHALARLHSGAPLAELQQELVQYKDKIAELGQAHPLQVQSIQCQVVHDLRETTSAKSTLAGPHYDQKHGLQEAAAAGDLMQTFHNHLASLVTNVFLGHTAAALRAARLGRSSLAKATLGVYLGPLFKFYEALANTLDAARGQFSLRTTSQLRSSRNALRKAAAYAPMNFLNKLHLLEAELCRHRGQDAAAAEHYEKAIELSIRNGFTHETALCQECAARFYFERGMTRMGRSFLRECHQSYQRWGADAKVVQLEKRYLQDFALLGHPAHSDSRALASGFAAALDYRVVLESSQAISGEVLLPKLLETLLRTTLRHAGAERGLLLLEVNSNLSIEVEADVGLGEPRSIAPEPLEGTKRLAVSIVHYVASTERPVVLADAVNDGMFTRDSYVIENAPRSVLCVPLLHQGRLLGVLYLENRRISHLFTASRVEVISLLASQAGISIASARFHALQLEAQQAKINPHFLFNALSSIADLAISDGRTAEQAIVRLANLYRYILTSSKEQLVSLDQELLVVGHYLDLEKLRFGSKLDFSIQAEGETRRVRLPGLLIQPLVENSVRHGISPKLGPGAVKVKTVVTDTQCFITVQDNGNGGKSLGGTGFGLRSVQERLALMYGDQYSFSISQADGYLVEIAIPLVARAR